MARLPVRRKAARADEAPEPAVAREQVVVRVVAAVAEAIRPLRARVLEPAVVLVPELVLAAEPVAELEEVLLLRLLPVRLASRGMCRSNP